MTFDYKKYSLENLEKWVEDAINSSGASPQEIYDVIKKVVEENYYTYKDRTEHCYELLALLNGNGVGHVTDQKLPDNKVPETKSNWTSFWEENYYPEEHKKFKEDIQDDGMRPWGHSDLEYQPRKLSTYDEMISLGYNMTADGFWIKETEETATSGASVSPKQNRWVLPVQQKIEEGVDDYFIQLPDDLLDQVNWKQNDQLIWIDRKDGTFELRKV